MIICPPICQGRAGCCVYCLTRHFPIKRAFLVAQLVKNPPTLQETLVRFLDWEDPLEKRQIAYPLQYSWASLVAPAAMRRPGCDPWVGKIPWRRERLPTPVSWPGEFHGMYSPWDSKELHTTERLTLSLFPLRCHLEKCYTSRKKTINVSHHSQTDSIKLLEQFFPFLWVISFGRWVAGSPCYLAWNFSFCL